jgi:uncharacterized protein
VPPALSTTSIVTQLQARWPALIGVYAFGSQVDGTADMQSDVDLAVLVPGYADPIALWQTAQDLAEHIGAPVDLLDLRAASTVMQHQILTRGERWFAQDPAATLFELAALREKFDLDIRRAELIDDIRARGSVYG